MAIRTLKNEVKSGLSAPLKATDHGLLRTLTKATIAKIFNIFEAGINSLLMNTNIISLDHTNVMITIGMHTIATYLSAS